jgi:hypothetical protein
VTAAMTLFVKKVKNKTDNNLSFCFFLKKFMQSIQARKHFNLIRHLDPEYYFDFKGYLIACIVSASQIWLFI